MDQISDYDYELPAELIAKVPLDRRDASRLLVVRRGDHTIEERSITNLPELLSPGDALVLNDTRVLPARLIGHRVNTGGKWEGLFLCANSDGTWKVIGQTRGHLQTGEEIAIIPAHPGDAKPELRLWLIEKDIDGIWTCQPSVDSGSPEPVLQQFGTMPLPPYMDRLIASNDDFERYQTTYASRPGAVAAPTAGLHFTPELLDRCKMAGVKQAKVTLHVGIGTFRPISVSRLDEHRMHSEWCELPVETARTLNGVRAKSGRIIAVGTTSVRTLESSARESDKMDTLPEQGWRGDTDLFIRPPYSFRAVDGLLTNFHLPRSTLFVLVCALGGRDLLMQAYQYAIRERFRFYSYGDAMLIL